MATKDSSRATGGARRPSRLGELLAKEKLQAAPMPTPEQRLLMALELSNAHLSHSACSKKH